MNQVISQYCWQLQHHYHG